MSRLAGSSKLLRAMNESAALAYLLDRGTLTRGHLRELTGLSKPTTSDVLRRLTDAGLAVVVGHTTGGPGPNAEIYAANPVAGYTAAISIRDTTETPRPALAAAMCDLSGAILARAESDPGAEDPTDTVTTAIADVCARAGVPADRVAHVQLGVPGSYDPGTDTIHHIDVAGWGRPGLIGALTDGLGATVGVDNDVNLAAIAERNRGVANEAGSFALLWISAGLGLAIDLGGTLLRGARGGAGEIGYLPLRPVNSDAQDLHDLVGGRAVVALAAEHGFTATTPEAAVAAAVESVAVDDASAKALVRALAERIALGLAAVSAVLDPPLVVLAGEVAQAGGAVLRDAVAEAFRTTTPYDTPIEVTGLTDDAVLLGALDAGRRAVRDTLIDSLRHTSA